MQELQIKNLEMESKRCEGKLLDLGSLTIVFVIIICLKLSEIGEENGCWGKNEQKRRLGIGKREQGIINRGNGS